MPSLALPLKGHTYAFLTLICPEFRDLMIELTSFCGGHIILNTGNIPTNINYQTCSIIIGKYHT